MTVLVQLNPSREPDRTPRAEDLLALARNSSPDARQRLLLGVMALCDASPPDGELSPILGEIFLSLARQAEREIRKVLATRLAHAEWAPPALVNVLALDEIEIAAPLLASSPVLRDDDLLQVLIQASLDHQIAVARRPGLSGRVADAVIEQAVPAVLAALATNRTAQISGEGFRRLVEHSRRVAALRGPLSRHPGLDQALAEQMYQWVGAALRESIVTRFQVDARKFDAAVYDAVDCVIRKDAHEVIPVDTPEREEMERRLVAKLQAAGQLKPALLIRAARERRLSLVVHSLAALGGFTVHQVREALRAASPEPMYYACAAIGIDRAVFPTLLIELRKLNRGLPGDQGNAVWQRGAISAASAARAFRALIPPETPEQRIAV
ncbi:DUF2336 domain-containing protein [Brevundimonas sp. FT23028]|uniref:DUF2336 domain-containing protein n=1 Tax=Brevundimonas sp. FT23028 TaxID=3393748 RepID=UPI003B588B1D